MNPECPSWVVVGFGRTGRSFAHILHEVGALAHVWTRRAPEPSAFYSKLPSSTGGVPELAGADVVLLALPDDMLGPFVRALPSPLRDDPRRVWLHLSGALCGEVLRSAGARGPVGSCHPLMSFAGDVGDVDRLSGAFFGIEGEPEAQAAARWLVDHAGGVAETIPSAAKNAYHAAAVLSSNGVYALLSAATRLCEDAGIRSERLPKAMAGLARGSAENAERLSLVEAATGPVVRGDANTVHAHLETLRHSGSVNTLYRALADVLLQLAREGQTARERSLDAVDAVLANEDR